MVEPLLENVGILSWRMWVSGGFCSMCLKLLVFLCKVPRVAGWRGALRNACGMSDVCGRMRHACLLVALLGCEASFDDLRQMSALDAGSPDRDATGAPDGGLDATSDLDASIDLDAGSISAPDGAFDAAAPAPRVVATGTWEGRGGYDAEGGVTLAHLGGDRYALITGDDFVSASVPSPVLLLSDREALGARLEPAEIRVATLSAAQIRGMHRYELTLDRVPTFAWVYCEPFGVETARARLEAP